MEGISLLSLISFLFCLWGLLCLIFVCNCHKQCLIVTTSICGHTVLQYRWYRCDCTAGTRGAEVQNIKAVSEIEHFSQTSMLNRKDVIVVDVFQHDMDNFKAFKAQKLLKIKKYILQRIDSYIDLPKINPWDMPAFHQSVCEARQFVGQYWV